MTNNHSHWKRKSLKNILNILNDSLKPDTSRFNGTGSVGINEGINHIIYQGKLLVHKGCIQYLVTWQFQGQIWKHNMWQGKHCSRDIEWPWPEFAIIPANRLYIIHVIQPKRIIHVEFRSYTDNQCVFIVYPLYIILSKHAGQWHKARRNEEDAILLNSLFYIFLIHSQ